MAVAIRTTDFPEGVGTDMYDGVQAAMDIANDPPQGLIFHWAGEVDGKWTVTDVWDAREAYDRFREERLSRRFRRSPAWIRPAVPSRRSLSSRSTTTPSPEQRASRPHRRSGGAPRFRPAR
jgi:hypothetical protein